MKNFKLSSLILAIFFILSNIYSANAQTCEESCYNEYQDCYYEQYLNLIGCLFDCEESYGYDIHEYYYDFCELTCDLRYDNNTYYCDINYDLCFDNC